MPGASEHLCSFSLFAGPSDFKDTASTITPGMLLPESLKADVSYNNVLGSNRPTRTPKLTIRRP